MLLWSILLLSVAGAAGLCWGIGAFQSLMWLLWLPLGFVGSFVVLIGLAFLFLWFMCQLVDQSVPQTHDSKFYRGMFTAYVHAAKVLTQLRLHTKGLENVPKTGRFLLVCNHLSLADPVILLHCFPKSQLAFISKKENADMFIVGNAMHKIMCQTLNRENDREALKTILKCIQLIKDDEVSIAVFPEGYIYADKKLHHFRNGVFKIAMKTKVPIVVCTLKNTPQFFTNLPKLKPTDVDVHLVKVIQPEEYEDITTVELGERIYQMMAEDLGPEMVSEET